MSTHPTKKRNARTSTTVPPCGLCGSTRKRRQKTDCCGNWICGNEGEYVMFSYSRDICARNHGRLTLCGFHHTEKHTGDWKTCDACRTSFDPETYVWYGTNRYNFEKLPHQSSFAPKHCDVCGRVLSFAGGGYTCFPNGRHACEDCYRIAPHEGDYTSDAPRQPFGVGCITNPDARRRNAPSADNTQTDVGESAVQSLFDKFFRWLDAQIAHDLNIEGAAVYGTMIDWAGLEKTYRDWWPDWDMHAVLGHAYRTMFTPRNDVGTIDPRAPGAQDYFGMFVMAEYPINGYITPSSDRVTFLRIFLERGGITLSPEEIRVAQQLLCIPNMFLRVDSVSDSGDIRINNPFMRETSTVHDPALARVYRPDTALFGKLILDERGRPAFAGNPAPVSDQHAFLHAASTALELYEVTHQTKKEKTAESLAESLHWNGYIAFRNIFDMRTADDWRHDRFFIGPFAPKERASRSKV